MVEAGRLCAGFRGERDQGDLGGATISKLAFCSRRRGGAAALAVIFGCRAPPRCGSDIGSAAVGAILRRGLARWSTNVFIQPFFARSSPALSVRLAVRYELSSSLRLVAVCPCMVLVPGPHFLNGALDLINGRIHLGAARLIYAVLIVVAISMWVVAWPRSSRRLLPVDPAGRGVPL